MPDDLLAKGLKLIICGSAGDTPAEPSHYYDGKGDRFWSTLAEVGLTPRELAPAESAELLQYGIGLVDIVKDQQAIDLGQKFAGDGAKVLRRKVRDFEPRYLAFNGKKTAQEFFGLKRIDFGLHSRMGATGVFVLPSTSTAARGDDMEYWRQVAKLVEG